MPLVPLLPIQARPTTPFVPQETWRSVFDRPNRSAVEQERAWRPVLDRLRAWVRASPAGADQARAGRRAGRDGLFRGATGVDLAWTAGPLVVDGDDRTFVFDLIVSKRVDAGLLPTRRAYAVVEPGRARLLPLVPAPLGTAVDLSAARRGRLLAVAGSVLPSPGAPLRPFAAVFRLRGDRWRTVARRIDPWVRGSDPFRVLATVLPGGVPSFTFQKLGFDAREASVETWRLRGATIRTVQGRRTDHAHRDLTRARAAAGDSPSKLSPKIESGVPFENHALRLARRISPRRSVTSPLRRTDPS